MAKDDYHVLVYQILSYLYQRLKKSEAVESRMLASDSPLFHGEIGKPYWAYIIYMLQNTGLITGVVFANIDGLNIPYPSVLSGCMITPAGIEYLCDNSFMEKAKRFLKDAKEIVPFT